MPTYLVLKKNYSGTKTFNNLPPSVTTLKNDKANIKAALRKYLHKHCFYCVGEFFMCIGGL